MNIQVTNFTPLQSKGSLQGFVSVLLTEPGLEIGGIAVHEKDGKRWLQLPAKPYKKSGGNKGWSYLISFREKENYQQFQNATLKAIDALQRQDRRNKTNGILTRFNQSLLKIDQAILSLRTEYKHTEQLISDLTNLLNGAITTDANLKEAV